MNIRRELLEGHDSLHELRKFEQVIHFENKHLHKIEKEFFHPIYKGCETTLPPRMRFALNYSFTIQIQ